MTISTIGTIHPNVHVYDSLYSCAGTCLKTQIACLLASEEPELQLNYMNVMMQSGTSECGVFAIAFATALAYGENPTQYLFDQSEMRSHLTTCLERGQMTMFPFKKLRKVKKQSRPWKKYIYTVPAACLIYRTQNGLSAPNARSGIMLHHVLLYIPKTAFKSKVPWFCLKCM